MDTGQDMFNLATRGEIQIAHFVQHFVHFVVDFVPNIVHFVQQHIVHFSHFAHILSNLIFLSLVMVSNIALLYNMSLVSSILFNLALLLKIVSLVMGYTDISWNFSTFPWRVTVTFTASHALPTELTSAVTCRDGCARGSIAVAVAFNMLPIFIMVIPFAIGVDGRIH